MARWEVPQPIPVDWTMRPLESARITLATLRDGRLEQVVEHAPLPGVTPAMCLWYLERVDRPMTFRGRRALAYRFWHPRDHIHFERLGKFGVGDRWHIVEMFQADPRYLVDGVFHVMKLDDSGFRMEVRVVGKPIVVADERWEPTPLGMRWTVTNTVGFTGPLLCRLNGKLRAEREAYFAAWRRHNVEEAGNLPCFLPELYEARAREA